MYYNYVYLVVTYSPNTWHLFYHSTTARSRKEETQKGHRNTNWESWMILTGLFTKGSFEKNIFCFVFSYFVIQRQPVPEKERPKKVIRVQIGNPEWSSQVSLQRAHLKRNINFDHSEFRFEFRWQFRVSFSRERAVVHTSQILFWYLSIQIWGGYD